MVITRTSDGEACVVSARTDDDNVECALEWAEGDAFELGGRNDLSAGLALEVQLTDSGAVVGDDDDVTFTDAGIDVTDPGEILNGGSCGPVIEGTMTRIAGSAVDAAERDLGGFACAQLSLAADIGGEVYLGELDVELVAGANPVRAWVPTDLGTRLAAAALNPAFLLQLLPDLLEAIEDGMRDAADAGLPAAVADPLRTGADGIEATRLAIDGYIDDFATALAGLAPGRPAGGRDRRPSSRRCSDSTPATSPCSRCATTAGPTRRAWAVTPCSTCATSAPRSPSARWSRRRPASTSGSRACR